MFTTIIKCHTGVPVFAQSRLWLTSLADIQLKMTAHYASVVPNLVLNGRGKQLSLAAFQAACF
jgi:hypothetical protein